MTPCSGPRSDSDAEAAAGARDCPTGDLVAVECTARVAISSGRSDGPPRPSHIDR